MTDAMIKASLTEEQQAAVKALDVIPGIGVVSAEQIIAETGTDMSHFRNQHSFSNWTGTAPGNNESAGKRKSGKTTHGNKTLKSTPTQCAKSAQKVKSSFFFAQYARLAAHRGKNRATMAVAHSMAIAIFFVLSGVEFKDLGADYYTQFNREKKINSHIKQLSKLGVVIPDDVLRLAAEQSSA
jgi:transposase